MAKKRSQGICGLCGEHSEVTREHFVPRCLWPGPLPAQTETIPACDKCNAGSNLDDEYFRNMLVMMFDQDHPQKNALFEGPVLRSLAKHPGWVEDFLKNMKIRPLLTPGGLWLGNYPSIPLDGDRFFGSLNKIVKGLFFMIRKQPFPADGQIGIISQLCAETKPLITMIEENLSPVFNYGDEVFEWQFAQNREGCTMWKLGFYHTAVFYAVGFEKPVDWQAEKSKRKVAQ
jgi:hypothetical protein